MNKLIYVLLAFFITQMAFADHHGSEPSTAEPFSVQVNLCTLKQSKNMRNYDKVFNAYVDWAQENNVDLFNARQTPLFTHADATNPLGYEFFDLLAGPFARQGKGWDLWMTTPEGQKLAAKWNEVADCNVRFGTGTVMFSKPEMETDNDRIISWNWCTVNEGVKVEQVMAAHAQAAASIADEAPMIGWVTLVPTVGAANIPGDFAHLVAYPDMESYMRMREYNAKGGWKNMRDYSALATCAGEAVNAETVIHRPSVEG
tara:strand:- start:607 stop:1380 length:774 start_codon:yes stop_codon:yes gene_type:complete